jgi:hypothetical protein
VKKNCFHHEINFHDITVYIVNLVFSNKIFVTVIIIIENTAQGLMLTLGRGKDGIEGVTH